MKNKTSNISVKQIEEIGRMLFIKGDFHQQTFEKHFHERFVFGINIAGGHDFNFGRRLETVGTDKIVVIPPGEIHTGIAHQKGEWKYMAIYPDIQTLNLLMGKDYFKTLKIHYPYISQHISKVYFLNLLNSLLVNDISAARENLMMFLSTLTDDPDAKRVDCRVNSRPQIITKIREYLLDNLESQLTLDDIAEHFAADKFHIVRLFQKYEGVSPMRFYRIARIEKSLEVIRQTKNIARAAVEMGFYDQSHLTNEIRKMFGFTPQKFLVSQI
ncbi:MAG: AraC family transcriptional regulator [Acidobacteriota bacterium]